MAMAMESATSTLAEGSVATTTADVALDGQDAAAIGPMPEIHACQSAIQPVVAAAAANGPGNFEVFFNNPENVPLDKRMPYIMMMATDCISGFDVKEIHPYSVFMNNRKLAGGGWVRKLNPNKDLVVQELKRRDPTARPNKSNRGADEIVQLFRPLTDPRDLDFIAKKESEIREKMLKVLEDCENKRTGRGSTGSSPKSKRPRRDGGEVGGNIEGGSQHIQSNGSLSMQAAEIVMDAAEEAAMSYKWKVYIAISDTEGNPMMVKRVDDPFPASFEIAVGKAKAAAQLGKRTGQVGDAHDVPRGGLAIVIDDVCCGGIGVSGEKPASLELIADAGIKALRNMSGSAQSSDDGNILDV